MAKNRLIFTLLLDRGQYMLSRNFRLQKVGNLDWLRKNYDFEAIAFSIDELVVLNVQRGQKNIQDFAANLSELVHNCFIPVAAGGGINSLDDAFAILAAGADKVVINTNLFRNPQLVKTLVTNFGSQCIVASIDYKRDADKTQVYIENGTENTGYSVEEAVKYVENLGVGEVYVTSIDRDGTGQGLDIEVLNKIVGLSSTNVIGSGGVGKYDQFVEGMKTANLQAVSTANLFYFMADGLIEARSVIKESGINLAQWETEYFHMPSSLPE